jgi:hypothetical protein
MVVVVPAVDVIFTSWSQTFWCQSRCIHYGTSGIWLWYILLSQLLLFKWVQFEQRGAQQFIDFTEFLSPKSDLDPLWHKMQGFEPMLRCPPSLLDKFVDRNGPIAGLWIRFRSRGLGMLLEDTVFNSTSPEQQCLSAASGTHFNKQQTSCWCQCHSRNFAMMSSGGLLRVFNFLR